MSRLPWLPLVPAALAVVYVGCSSHAPASPGTAKTVGNAPVNDATITYEGNVTAAALTALGAGTPVDDSARGGIFDTPLDNSELGAMPVAFTWHFGAQAGRTPAKTRRFGSLERAPSKRWGRERPQTPPPTVGFKSMTLVPEPASSSTWLSPLRELFGERSAFAATGGFTGTATFIHFSTGASPTLFRVFTTDTSFLPDETVWKTLAVGTWVNAQLVTATFENDSIVPDGGPFTGTSINICVDMN